MDDTVAETLGRARDLLDAGNEDDAFLEVYTLLDWTGDEALVADAGAFAQALALLGRCQSFGPEVAEKAAAATQAPGAPGPLYDLGYTLVETDFAGLAATVLQRARRVAPDDEAVLNELVAALEANDMGAEAIRTLESAGDLAERFMPRYLLAFNRAATGDLAGAARLAPSLRDDADTDTQRFLARRVAGITARGEALDPGDDPRAWEMVLSASLLLWTGTGKAGRFDRAQDEPAQLRRALEQVAVLLQGRSIDVPRVFVFPHHRPSHGLGLAAARRLDVEAVTWDPDVADLPGLLVAWEVTALGQPSGERLVRQRAGQVLWGHGTRWHRDHRVAADVTTHLFKDPRVAWSKLSKIDPQALCDEILAAPAGDDTAEQLAPARAILDRLAGLEPELGSALARTDGERERRWRLSPLG